MATKNDTMATVKGVQAAVLARMLGAFEHAGNIARMVNDAERAVSQEKAVIWHEMAGIGAEFLAEAKKTTPNDKEAYSAAFVQFAAHWEVVKPDLTKPENVTRFGSEPSGAKPGKFTINRTITEAVSRVKGALERRIALTGDKGKLRGSSDIANAVKEWNTNRDKLEAQRKEREALKADPQRKVRLEIAGEIGALGIRIQSGTHSAAVLTKVRDVLATVNKVLSEDEADRAAKAEAEAEEAAKGKKAA